MADPAASRARYRALSDPTRTRDGTPQPTYDQVPTTLWEAPLLPLTDPVLLLALLYPPPPDERWYLLPEE